MRRSGIFLAEVLVGAGVAVVLVMAVCTMLGQWCTRLGQLDERAALLDVASRLAAAAGREDFQRLERCVDEGADAWIKEVLGPDARPAEQKAEVTRTADADLLAVRITVRRERGTVELARLVARPETSLRAGGAK